MKNLIMSFKCESEQNPNSMILLAAQKRMDTSAQAKVKMKREMVSVVATEPQQLPLTTMEIAVQLASIRKEFRSAFLIE